MEWIKIDSGECTGKYNMDYDLQLVENCTPETAYLRFYQWKPYCISLGSNQKEDDVFVERLKTDNIDLVRRPTGGRAVFHAEELTYSVVTYLFDNLTPMMLYEKINNALLTGLKLYSNKLNNLELEKNQPDFAQAYKQPDGFACFSTAAKSEVKYQSRKLIGSAQRKMGDKILQHGSIICGSYHKKIVDYMNVPEKFLSVVKNELERKTVTIEEIINEKVNYELMKDKISKGFISQWGIEGWKSYNNPK